MKQGIRLKTRNDLHLARKAWHISSGLFGLWLFSLSGLSKLGSIAFLSSFLVFSISVELLRFRFPSVNQLSQRLLKPIMRKHEIDSVSGVPFFVGAALISIIIFPKPIAILAVLYLTVGDPSASIFGILYGDHGARFPNGKSLIGAVAGGLICMAISFPILVAFAVPFPAVIPIALLGGASASFAEVAPLKFDDNFVIPLFSGTVLWLSFLIFGVGF